MTQPGMAVEDLEALWERLAETIDAVGGERAPLFLAKLALLMGNAIGDAARVDALIDAARADLG
jgi:hypothetical protein